MMRGGLVVARSCNLIHSARVWGDDYANERERDVAMKKFMLALGAVSLLAPASLVLPLPGAKVEAKSKRYKYREWRGRDGRYYCRKSNGTTGLIIGGAAGALAGRAIDTRGDRTIGTLGGAAAGALLGREIDRGGSKRRCR